LNLKPYLLPQDVYRQFVGLRNRGSLENRGNMGNLDPHSSEAFLKSAIEDWIPPARISPAPSQRELNRLAQELQENHGDRWLADFMAAPPSSKAVEFLRSAMAANAGGDPQAAGKAAASAEKLFQQAENLPGVARSRFESVYALHRQYKMAECLSLGRQLNSMVSKRHYVWLEIQTLLELATCEDLSGNFDPAWDLVDKSRKEAEQSRYGGLFLRAVGFGASLALLEGRIDICWKRNEEGLSSFWDGIYPGERGYQFYADLEQAAEKTGQWLLAENLQREALGLVEESSHQDLKALARAHMAMVAQRAGDQPESQVQLELAQSIFRRLPANATTHLYEASTDIAVAEVAVRQGNVGAASSLLEKVEGEAANRNDLPIGLHYWLAKAEVDRRLHRTQEEQVSLERAISVGKHGFQALRSPKDSWTWRREMGPAYRRLMEIERLHPHEAAQALADWEAFRAIGARNGSLDSVTQNRGARQFVLDRIGKLSDATLIVFAVSSNGIDAWVADNRGIREVHIDLDREAIGDKAERFYRLCADRSSPLRDVRNAGDELYRLLFARLEPSIDASRTLLLDADELLSGIPWAALVTSDGQYFGEKYQFAVVPGLLFHPQGGSSIASFSVGKVLIVNPTAAAFRGQFFAPLPQAEEEAHELSHLFPGSTYLQGRHANLRELIHSLPDAAVFHFSGHAIGSEQGGELLLSGEDHNVLSAAVLSGMRLPHCRLVVLSACSTAVAEQDIVRNPDGLVQAFFSAGAQTVIASRWDVDSGATAALMVECYRALRSGLRLPAALKTARDFLRSHPATNTPYYWASFEVFESGA